MWKRGHSTKISSPAWVLTTLRAFSREEKSESVPCWWTEKEKKQKFIFLEASRAIKRRNFHRRSNLISQYNLLYTFLISKSQHVAHTTRKKCSEKIFFFRLFIFISKKIIFFFSGFVCTNSRSFLVDQASSSERQSPGICYFFSLCFHEEKWRKKNLFSRCQPIVISFLAKTASGKKPAE